MQKDYIFERMKLKQTAIFDLEELYKSLFRWFEVYGYNFYEAEYQDIDEPKGKHIEIAWIAEKTIDAYVRFVIEVDFLIIGMADAEIEKEGLKVKTNKGTIELRLTAYLLKDYNKKWSETPVHQGIRKIYDKIIIRNRLERYETELFIECHKLVDEIKAFMNLHQL